MIIKAIAGDNYEFGPGQPTHIRDAYVQALSQQAHLAVDERSYEPGVLYVNGQFWGVYDIREKVDDHDFTKYYYDQDKFNIQMIKTQEERGASTVDHKPKRIGMPCAPTLPPTTWATRPLSLMSTNNSVGSRWLIISV
ncbi:MAG: CotH kinase family protein [Flavobacteriales bacterium]|nr:CotH kinase family protein [Flavobacteriales bacterium]